MNDVLKQVKLLLESNLTGQFKVSRVEVGYWADSISIMRMGDMPAILIEPQGESVGISQVGNHLKVEYTIKCYVVTYMRVPKEALIVVNEESQWKTVNQYTNEIIRVIGSNKRLANKVRLLSSDFQVESFVDESDRQVKSILVKYINELIPYASATINQTNMIKQI